MFWVVVLLLLMAMAMVVVMILLWLGKSANNRDRIIGAKGCVEVVLAAGLAWLSLMLVVHDFGSGKRRRKKKKEDGGREWL